MKRPLSISLIIPVYNEENHIAACLDSVAAQTDMPDEVIVVDNNSTDNTIIIASSYDFVTIVKEPVQGYIAARNRGFNSARGDILGRINADVTLSKDWVKTVRSTMQNEGLAGITGPAETILFPGQETVKTSIFSYGYIFGAEAFFDTYIMWGANMAMLRSEWQAIREYAHDDQKIVHEDQDLSLLIASRGGRIRTCNAMRVATNEMSYFYWPKLREYWLRRWRTRAIYVDKGVYGEQQMQRLTAYGYLWRSPFVFGNGLFALLSLLTYLPTRLALYLRHLISAPIN